jgi:hypothetical protein
MAKQKAVTYAELVRKLRQLEYAPDPKQSAEGYTVLRHPGRQIRIFLPALKDRTPVREIYLVGVKRILAESAPAAAQEFEAWLDGRGSRGARGVPAR